MDNLDKKEYISSGILELYSAGLLENAESESVEKILQNNPDIRSEYENIQKAIYVSALPKLLFPPENLKSSVLKKVKEKGKQYSVNNSVSNTFRYLMAACIAFLLFSLVVNYFLWNKLKEARNEILVMNDERRIMVQDLEEVNQKMNRSSEDMKIVKDRNYKMIELNGLEKSPSSEAVAFWNPENKKLYIGVMNLPVPPPDKQYQLWAISNGKPVDAGVMDVDPSDKSLHEMKNMDDAQAFAVTLEPKGGSINPTLDQMYVMGKL